MEVRVSDFYEILYTYMHCCGSRSGLDPDSMGSLDPYPDPDLQSRSGFKRPKMTLKHRKKLNLIFRSTG